MSNAEGHLSTEHWFPQALRSTSEAKGTPGLGVRPSYLRAIEAVWAWASDEASEQPLLVHVLPLGIHNIVTQGRGRSLRGPRLSGHSGHPSRRHERSPDEPKDHIEDREAKQQT